MNTIQQGMAVLTILAAIFFIVQQVLEARTSKIAVKAKMEAAAEARKLSKDTVEAEKEETLEEKIDKLHDLVQDTLDMVIAYKRTK